MNDEDFNQDRTPRLAASPIDIPTGGRRLDSEGKRRKTRRRRDSEASSSLSSLSETFSTESPSPTTPPADSPPPQEEGLSPEVATSPILSYFMSHASPIKSARSFSFRDKPKLATSPGTTNALEDVDGLPHVLHHARRMSQNWDQTKTIGIPQKLPPTESQQERNNSIMRRLSLSGSAQRPNAQSLARTMESKSIISPVPAEKMAQVPRRSATLSAAAVRRPPSPMGERMLKGDFHGF